MQMQNEIEQRIELELKKIDQKFSGAIDQLVLQYDDNLKKAIPEPKLLPIRVNILIECKPDFKQDNAHVKPYDTVNDVFKVVEDFLANRGDPVLAWNKAGLRFLLTGPLYDPARQPQQDADGDEVMAESQSLSQ